MKSGSRPTAPHGKATNKDHPCHPVATSNNKHPPATEAQDTKLERILRTMSASPAGANCVASRRRIGRRPTSGLRGMGRAGGDGNRGARCAGPPEVRRDRDIVALRASSARRSASAVGQRSSGSFSRERITQAARSEEHTSELQSRLHLVCRLLLEKKKHRPLPDSRG